MPIDVSIERVAEAMQAYVSLTPSTTEMKITQENMIKVSRSVNGIATPLIKTYTHQEFITLTEKLKGLVKNDPRNLTERDLRSITGKYSARFQRALTNYRNFNPHSPLPAFAEKGASIILYDIHLMPVKKYSVKEFIKQYDNPVDPEEKIGFIQRLVRCVKSILQKTDEISPLDVEMNKIEDCLETPLYFNR